MCYMKHYDEEGNFLKKLHEIKSACSFFGKNFFVPDSDSNLRTVSHFLIFAYNISHLHTISHILIYCIYIWYVYKYINFTSYKFMLYKFMLNFVINLRYNTYIYVDVIYVNICLYFLLYLRTISHICVICIQISPFLSVSLI